jgi:large subunit ribosomal protein L32
VDHGAICLLLIVGYSSVYMVVRMRVNRSKTGKRRSHHALLATRLITCECGALRQNHRACQSCGKYNGHVAIDVVAEATRQAKRNKRRDKALRESGRAKDTTSDKEKSTT